jgi:hypothetical protein
MNKSYNRGKHDIGMKLLTEIEIATGKRGY